MNREREINRLSRRLFDSTTKSVRARVKWVKVEERESCAKDIALVAKAWPPPHVPNAPNYLQYGTFSRILPLFVFTIQNALSSALQRK
jgi:hypothetical protein